MTSTREALASSFFFAVAAAASAQEPPELVQSPLAPNRDAYLTLYFDNDLFGGSDRDYTSGLRLSWISGNRTIEEIPRAQRWLRRISGDPESFGAFRSITGFEDPDKIHYNYGFSLTQLMFTPDDPAPAFQPPGERRYAGWLGLGLSLHVKDDRILNSVEFIFGTTGERSFAEESQDFIHGLRDIEKYNGWDSQIPNEFTFDISFEQKRRLDLAKVGYGVIRVDGLSEWGLRLGTFRTEANVGGLFRVGYNLPPDFSDPRLTSTAYSHRYFDADDIDVGDWSVYALFGVNGSVVAHDATLDGPLFNDFETGNDRRPLVGEVYAGLGVRFREIEFSYVHTWRTREYDEQDGVADFGSVAVRYRF